MAEIKRHASMPLLSTNGIAKPSVFTNSNGTAAFKNADRIA
jgi:hypothetical protein